LVLKNKIVSVFVFVLIIQTTCLFAQTDKECINEVIELIKLNDYKNDTSLKGKNVFLNYSVKVTDWEDEVVTSSVKIYKKDGQLQMFSEQVNIYQDDREVLFIFPTQKLVVLNSTDKSLNNLKMTNYFYENRNDFLSNCEVIKCSILQGDIKQLVIKVNPIKVNEDVKIVQVTYNYNLVSKKIISTKVDYNSDYKLKQMFTTYIDFKVINDYKFYPAKSYYISKKGTTNPKYLGYQFMDNRDEKRK